MLSQIFSDGGGGGGGRKSFPSPQKEAEVEQELMRRFQTEDDDMLDMSDRDATIQNTKLNETPPRLRRNRRSMSGTSMGSEKTVDFDAELEVSFQHMTWRQAPQRLCAFIFILFEIEESSSMAKGMALLTRFVIIFATIAYIISSDPALRIIPDTCDSPVCDNDHLLCPGYQICQDVISNEFDWIENICVYFFTAEYGVRLLTCWAVTPRVAGVIPAWWEELHKDKHDAPQPTYPVLYTMLKFSLKFSNLIDLASILPHYLQYFSTGNNAGSSFVRVLRLLRVLRILRLLRLLAFLKNVDVAAQIIAATITEGSLILSVFCFFVMIVVILFGCIIFLAEQGTFAVNVQYPNGAYIRLASDGVNTEISPFDSVLTGMYFTIGSATGNGDLSVTSSAGRAIASILDIVGVFGLAFPIGVIGTELDRAYRKHYQKLVKQAEDRQKKLMLAASQIAEVELKQKTPTQSLRISDKEGGRRRVGSILGGTWDKVVNNITRQIAVENIIPEGEESNSSVSEGNPDAGSPHKPTTLSKQQSILDLVIAARTALDQPEPDGQLDLQPRRSVIFQLDKRDRAIKFARAIKSAAEEMKEVTRQGGESPVGFTAGRRGPTDLVGFATAAADATAATTPLSSRTSLATSSSTSSSSLIKIQKLIENARTDVQNAQQRLMDLLSLEMQLKSTSGLPALTPLTRSSRDRRNVTIHAAVLDSGGARTVDGATAGDRPILGAVSTPLDDGR